MKRGVYLEEARNHLHWWFVGRRQLLSSILSELNLPPNARVLDVGTSSGTNLKMLLDNGFSTNVGVDISPLAARLCAQQGLESICVASVLRLPFTAEAFDLVLATDVIEHVEDDAAAVNEIKRVLKRGGTAIITVPAFQSLWGLQDDVSHHFRRYRIEQARELTRRAGLDSHESFYFNFLLFGPIWLARQILRLFAVKLDSENQINTPLLNRILTRVFAFDVRIARRLKPPFGVSALLVCRHRE